MTLATASAVFPRRYLMGYVKTGLSGIEKVFMLVKSICRPYDQDKVMSMCVRVCALQSKGGSGQEGEKERKRQRGRMTWKEEGEEGTDI